MSKFYENDLSLDTLWRSIILLGSNNKSYKFALAKSLIELAQAEKTEITRRELAPIFAKHTLEHVKKGLIQGPGSKKGPFLQACEDYLDPSHPLTLDELHSITEKKAFDNVIRRFHTVNRDETPKTFYDWSAFNDEKKIVLKDDVIKLIKGIHGKNLIHEVEARWSLVENSWDLQIPANLLEVEFDKDTKLFYISKNIDGKKRRRDITSSRDALNGYQKGHCFFCFSNISLIPNDPNICHVDHFFPHTLFDRLNNNINWDGVWNLVLSCSDCNSTKNAMFPARLYLDRLHRRNEFYVSSHLPLRESILRTGKTEKDRISFLQARFNESRESLISEFKTENKLPPRF